ncbi:MAG: metal ABC transporter substrate-binding protein [Candidatus Borkfalkiaceae bacterium]|nr:metal ABC transporter substrate-binding protein [Christensenellaceae bacterium]
MMKKIKKYTAIIIAAIAAFSCVIFASCENNENKKEKLSVVCTIFPEYDWVKELSGGENANIDLKLLLDSGADLHNYQPTVADLATIYACDLFIYVGGESDEWVTAALKNATNKNMKTINLLQVLGEKVKDEEHIDGMQPEKGGTDVDDSDHNHGEHEHEKDEHVWLSVKNAAVICEKIAAELAVIDSENASVYAENLVKYTQKLNALDDEFLNVVNAAKHKTFVFGDRFPFRYLADDYGINYFAAFSGCSAESEASFETIVFLSEKIDELSLPAVCKIEGSSQKIAEQIKQNTKNKNQKIIAFDSLQSVTASDLKSGKNYISAMQNNLTALKQALGA